MQRNYQELKVSKSLIEEKLNYQLKDNTNKELRLATAMLQDAWR